MEEIYALFKEITNKVTEEVIGFKKSQVEGLDLETEKLCESRRKARAEVMHEPSEQNIENYKQVKSKVRT